MACFSGNTWLCYALYYSLSLSVVCCLRHIVIAHSTYPFQVEIIPWVISDATYTANSSVKLDWKKTVFVGALHGMITARVKVSSSAFSMILFEWWRSSLWTSSRPNRGYKGNKRGNICKWMGSDMMRSLLDGINRRLVFLKNNRSWQLVEL